MNPRTLLAAVATAATLALTNPTPTLAQEGGMGSVARSERELISVDFKGGSLADFIAQIRQAAGPMPVNIIYPPEFADLRLPPMQFEQVYLDSALEIAAYISEYRTISMPDGREAGWEVEQLPGGRGTSVFVINAWAEDIPQEHEHDDEEHEEHFERATIVQSLAGLIAGEHAMSADAVLSSIQIALDMVEQGDADLRFHEDTGLLFARVTGDQHYALEQTVRRLSESASFMRRAQTHSEFDRFFEAIGVGSKEAAVQIVNEAREAIERAEAMQREMSVMERDMKAEFDGARRHIGQMEQEIAALSTQLREARTMAEELERHNQRLRAEAQNLRSQLLMLRDQQEPRQ
ncbi:MAG: hypothetical protein RIB58_03545 [Phycisphaerales bacterium]